MTIHFFVESLFSFFFSVLSSDFTWLVSEVATILESSKVSAEEIIAESGVGILIVFEESIEEVKLSMLSLKGTELTKLESSLVSESSILLSLVFSIFEKLSNRSPGVSTRPH